MTVNKVYNAGDVVLDGCQPFVIQILDKERNNRCHYCTHKCDQLKKCGQCGMLMYCSRECQTADWKDIHKLNECKLLKETKDFKYDHDDLKFVRLVLKATFDRQSRQRIYRLWDGRARQLDDLLSHQDKINWNRLLAANRMIKHLMHHLDKLFNIKLSQDELRRWYGVLEINSMLLVDIYTNEDYAAALYIDGSALDHDCRPSCVRLYNGRQLQIRAMRQLRVPDEQPTTTYLDEMDTNREQRRQLLSEHYFFVCQCKRCEDETDRDFDFTRYHYLLNNHKDNDVDYWEELIKMQRSLFGEHYPGITHCLSQKFIAMGSSLPAQPSRAMIKKWRDLGKQFQSELKITHDDSQGEYEEITQTMRQLDLMAGSKVH